MRVVKVRSPQWPAYVFFVIGAFGVPVSLLVMSEGSQASVLIGAAVLISQILFLAMAASSYAVVCRGDNMRIETLWSRSVNCQELGGLTVLEHANGQLGIYLRDVLLLVEIRKFFDPPPIDARTRAMGNVVAELERACC